MKKTALFSALIETIGYDPQCAILEVKLLRDGRVLYYKGVPEDVWYHLRETCHPDLYYRRCICGRFQELKFPDAGWYTAEQTEA